MEGLGRNLILGQDPHERDALRRFKCMTRQDVREKIPNNAATLPSQLIQEIPRRLALASDSRPDHRPQHKPKRGGGTKIHTTSTELQTDGRSDRQTHVTLGTRQRDKLIKM